MLYYCKKAVFNIQTSKGPKRQNWTKTAFTAITIIFLFFILGVVLYLSNCKINKSQYQIEYQDLIEKYSNEYKVSEALILAVIKTESNFDKDAESSAGAIGLMQLMPDTFEWLQVYYNNEVTMNSDSLYDTDINIKYGTLFLSYLLKKYNNCEETAVAAYNAGLGTVDDWLSDSRYSANGTSLDNIPYPETKGYVLKVELAKQNYIDIYGL